MSTADQNVIIGIIIGIGLVQWVVPVVTQWWHGDNET